MESQSVLGPVPGTAVDVDVDGDDVPVPARPFCGEGGSSTKDRQKGEPPPPLPPSPPNGGEADSLTGEPDSPAVVSSVCGVFLRRRSLPGDDAAATGVVVTASTVSSRPASTAVAVGGELVVLRLEGAGEDGDKLGRFFWSLGGEVAKREEDGGGAAPSSAGDGE